MNYYEILEIDIKATKEEIKKKYYSLSKKYHPDKNNGEDKHFKKIKEAYDILYDDEERKKYDIQLLFGDINFTEEDIELLDRYYKRLINSNEFKLLKLLYNSIPQNVKTDIWNKFKKASKKYIVKAHKSIDIRYLFHNETINLFIKKEDYINKKIKILYIFTNNGIYYLYLRERYPKLIIDNLGCFLTINFYIN
jgi:curved DNA-binding protein CbpA